MLQNIAFCHLASTKLYYCNFLFSYFSIYFNIFCHLASAKLYYVHGKALHCHLDLALLRLNNVLTFNLELSHLGVKWITLQLIDALELASVGLVHRQSILSPSVDLSLIDHLQAASYKVSLSCYCHPCHPFSIPVLACMV